MNYNSNYNNNYTNRGVGNRRRRRKKNNYIPFFCFICVWLFILGVIFLVAHVKKNSSSDADDGTSYSSTQANAEETDGSSGGGSSANSGGDAASSDQASATTASGPETDEPLTYQEATILSVGDILPHMALVNYAKAIGTDGGYDFSNSFKYITDIVSSADYAVANLETTLAGPTVKYDGFPNFNTPDEILDAAKSAGFDMMLFANNHCYDTGLTGFLRTQEQIEARGLDYIGAKKDPSDKAYKVVDINGIKVGMFNYADDLSGGNTERRTINGKAIKDGELGYMNLYNLSLLDELYSEVDSVIAAMKDEGADLIIAYMHWGSEYNIKHNSYQEKVAQALADRGVDVIIGGHPHVIEDVEVITSSADPTHKTLCFYSLGNIVSNQNRRTLGDTTNKVYTEGGLIVTLTVRKYSNGDVLVTKAEQTPTFVHRHSADGGYVHEIVPIEAALADPAKYGLDKTDFGKTEAKEVFDLETEVLGETVAVFNGSVTLPAEA